jgi:5-methylcytosine-specific restriction endonuclease McrA
VSAELLTKLIAAGMPAELVAEVAMALAVTASNQDIIERRRQSERERSRRYRDRGGGQIPGWLRRQVFERDEYRCVDCGAEDDLQCDHVMPVSRGGDTTFDNLQTLCCPCNARKRDRVRKADKRGITRTGADRDGESGSSRTSEEGTAAPLDKKAPPDPLKELNPPAPTDEAGASSVPPAGVEPVGSTPKVRRKGKRKPGSRLTADWQPPAIEALPLEFQAIVAKWPDGAYPLTALQFRNHWLAEGRAIGAKRDWMRTWCNWLYRENAQILLLVRRGFDFSAGRAAEAPAAVKAERDTEAGRRLAAMRDAEGDAARAIRQRIRDDAGERTYAGWIAPAAIAVDSGEVTVTSASDFMGSWLEQHFAATIQAVAGTVLGRPARVVFRVLRIGADTS